MKKTLLKQFIQEEIRIVLKESVNPGGLEVGFFEVIKDFFISPGGGWRINFKKGEYLRSNINGLQRLVGPNKFKDVRPPISGTDNLDITLYGTHFDQNRMREEFDNNTKEIQKFGKIISTGGSINEAKKFSPLEALKYLGKQGYSSSKIKFDRELGGAMSFKVDGNVIGRLNAKGELVDLK